MLAEGGRDEIGLALAHVVSMLWLVSLNSSKNFSHSASFALEQVKFFFFQVNSQVQGL